MTANPAAELLDASVAVAAYPPADGRGQHVSKALVYWPLIDRLRLALDAMGIDWREAAR